MSYLLYSLADAPAAGYPEPLAGILSNLGAGPILNHPVTGTQGSPRMIPSTWGYMAAKAAGVLGKDHKRRAKEWLAQEARWRGLPNGEPEMFATQPNGELLLNDQGKPIVPNVWDGQHLTLRQYLDLHCLYDEMLALQMAGAVIKQVKLYYQPDRVAKLQNQREIGRVLRATADWYAAVEDPSVLTLAANLVDHCAASMKTENGVPWVTLNTNKRADHAFCQVCTWQTVTIGDALIAWSRITDLTPQAKAVLEQVRACMSYARAKGEELGGFMVPDYDPNGSVNPQTNNAMLRWCLMVMMDAGGQLAADATAYWMAADWSRMADKNFDNQHALSINLAMGRTLGFH